MKNNKDLKTDKINPYRNMGLGKITSPVTNKNQPKSTRIEGTGDLRGGKK